MITRITVENFMSHVHTVIEPCGSLTVLVGPNNCGKSAFLSAIQVLARDVDGDFMVRHGEKEARILLETDEGHTVQWRRKGAVVTYGIDGQDVHRNTPDGLAEIVRMPIVPGPGKSPEKFDVHFGDQKQPIFLIDKPGSHAATFFASASDAEYLVRMQTLHKQRTRDTKTDQVRLTKEIRSLEARIEAQVPAEALAERLSKQELEFKTIEAAELNIEQIRNAMERLVEATSAQDSVSRNYQPLAKGIPAPPEMRDTFALGDAIERLSSAAQSSLVEARRLAVTERLPEPPELLDLTGIRAVGQELVRADKERADCDVALASATLALGQFLAEVEMWSAQNPTCPTCGQPVSKETVLDRLEVSVG